jgi:septum site-determining protein MinC
MLIAIEAPSVAECVRIPLSTNLESSPKDAAADTPLPVVDIRYGQVGLLHVRIRTLDPGAILDELTGRVAAAPHFFRRTAVCLDLIALEKMPEAAEIRAVIEAVRRAGMLVVGLAGDSDGLLDAVAIPLNLPVISSFRARARPVPVLQPAQPAPAAPEPAQESVPAPAPAPAESSVPALIHSQTVRSGQRVYARNRDLIVNAGVGAGAEVMADGCLHIYGSLRGRAMAGAHGESAARVFCQEFYAELVSIAGVFRVFETIPAELAGMPVQAWLAGEDLHFARIGG